VRVTFGFMRAWRACGRVISPSAATWTTPIVLDDSRVSRGWFALRRRVVSTRFSMPSVTCTCSATASSAEIQRLQSGHALNNKLLRELIGTQSRLA